MKKGFQLTGLPYKRFLVLLLVVNAFFIAHSQNVAMHSGKTLERKDFKENSLRYNDFVNNRGRLNASSVIFTPDKEAMIGFSADRKDTYNFMVFEDYINIKGIRQVNAEVPSKSEATLNAFVRIRDKNFVVYSQYTKSNKETIVYVNEMSSSNVLLGTPIKVLTVGEEKNKIYGDVRVHTSKNKKSILIYQATEGNGKDTRRISCSVVDEKKFRCGLAK